MYSCFLIQDSRVTNKRFSWWLCSCSLIQHSRATNKWLSWWRCSCCQIQHSRLTNKWLSWWLCSYCQINKDRYGHQEVLHFVGVNLQMDRICQVLLVNHHIMDTNTMGQLQDTSIPRPPIRHNPVQGTTQSSVTDSRVAACQLRTCSNMQRLVSHSHAPNTQCPS